MTLSKRMVVGAVSVVALLTGVAVEAQSVDTRAVIPFEFTVAGTTLPAGTYWLTPMAGANSALQLRSVHGGVIMMTPPADRGDRDGKPQLTFNRYGERYFLHQVRLSDNREYTVRPTSEEREMVQRVADGTAPAPTVVRVAANNR